MPKDSEFVSSQKWCQQALHLSAVTEQPVEISDERERDRFTTKVPEDRAQLWIDMERQAMIDSPHASVKTSQKEMTRLSVGIVGEQIEERDALELPTKRRAAQWLVLRFDEQLNGSNTVRSITDDCGRDESPAQDATQEIAGKLALIEGAGWEVPQRCFTTCRLVNTDEPWNNILFEEYGECVVRTPRNKLHVFHGSDREGASDLAHVASSLRREEMMANSAIGELSRHRSPLAPSALAQCATTLTQQGRWLQVTAAE